MDTDAMSAQTALNEARTIDATDVVWMYWGPIGVFNGRRVVLLIGTNGRLLEMIDAEEFYA